MAQVDDVTPRVRLRTVEDQDVDVFFDHQADPEAVEMAAFPARDRDQVAAHWSRLRADDTKVTRTIVVDGLVAGNIGSWQDDGQQLLGYWIGRDFWGRGVATQALALLLEEVSIRPLYAHVVVHNLGSIRVLEKCGFRRDRTQEAEAAPPDDGIEEFVFVLDAGGSGTVARQRSRRMTAKCETRTIARPLTAFQAVARCGLGSDA